MPAETLHNAPGGTSDERDIAAKLKQQYEKAQFDADQKEAFGKFDITAPNEGEETYQSYLDKRPSEGVIRDGENYRNVQAGTFASEQAYEDQKGTTQAYYDQLGGIGNQAEYDPHYEEMGVMQLAKEAAKARKIGDIAEEAAIREALDTRLTIDAMNDDKETPEAAQARYEAEVTRYDALVDKLSSDREKAVPAPESPTATPDAEVHEVTEEADAQEASEVSETSEESETLEAEEALEESESSEAVFFNGEKVTLGEPFTSPDGKSRVYQATKEDGTVEWVSDTQLTRSSAESASESESNDDSVEEEQKVERNERSALEKMKGFFKKELRQLQEFGGLVYFGHLIERSRKGIRSVTLDAGITEDMPEDEVEKKRQRNRRNVMIGVGVLGVVGLGSIIATGVQNDWFGGGAPDMTGGGATGDGEPVSDKLKGVLDGSTPTDYELPPVTIEAIPAPSVEFNIADGLSGLKLFDNLGIDSDTWYANQDTLLAKFPSEFYRMLDGNVGIAHPGWLSTGAQNFINELK